MKIAYVGNFTQPHCTEVHISKTLQSMGHQVTEIQEDPSNLHGFIDKVKGHDLFLFTRTWNNLVTMEHLFQFKAMGIPSASYHLDLYVGLQREAGLDNDPFWRTDYVFSPDGAESSQRVFESKRINHHYIKPGVFRDECIMLDKNEDKTLGNDVVFVGGGSLYMHKEWPYRKQLVTWLQKTFKRNYSKYGHPERTVRNMELNQLYANSRVVVGDSLCLNFDHPYYWSDRVYETIGRGGFIIHPYIPGMEEEFTDGENIVFYNFNDWDGLRDKINYYINNVHERNRIRQNGFEFVKNNATYNNRLQQMLDIIFTNNQAVDENKSSSVIINPNIRHSKFDSPEPLKINLGAGEDQFEGYINVDLVDIPGIDIVHNLMKFPYPFDDETAIEIKAVDVVEHLANYTEDYRPTIIAFIEECHRILKQGGELYIQTPGWKADFLWIDPTHVRGFDIQSFDFFDPEKPFGKTTGFYSKAKFEVKAEELPNHNLRFWLKKK